MAHSGRTAVVIPVPALDPVLDAIGARWPGLVRPGVPAHLTVLYPFVAAADLTDGVAARCRALCAGTGPLRVAFRRVTATPSIVSAAPEPAGPVTALCRAFAACWPEHPPYRGRFGPDPAPHLTLALDPGPDRTAAVAALAAAYLPVEVDLTAAVLVETTAGGWAERAVLTL